MMSSDLMMAIGYRVSRSLEDVMDPMISMVSRVSPEGITIITPLLLLLLYREHVCSIKRGIMYRNVSLYDHANSYLRRSRDDHTLWKRSSDRLMDRYTESISEG